MAAPHGSPEQVRGQAASEPYGNEKGRIAVKKNVYLRNVSVPSNIPGKPDNFVRLRYILSFATTLLLFFVCTGIAHGNPVTIENVTINDGSKAIPFVTANQAFYVSTLVLNRGNSFIGAYMITRVVQGTTEIAKAQNSYDLLPSSQIYNRRGPPVNAGALRINSPGHYTLIVSIHRKGFRWTDPSSVLVTYTQTIECRGSQGRETDGRQRAEADRLAREAEAQRIRQAEVAARRRAAEQAGRDRQATRRLREPQLAVLSARGRNADSGYEWRNLNLQLSGRTLSYSFDMKIWKTTDNYPITQMFLVANDNTALAAFYNSVPNYERNESFRRYSGTLELPASLSETGVVNIQFFKGLHYSVEQAIRDQVSKGRGGSRTIIARITR